MNNPEIFDDQVHVRRFSNSKKQVVSLQMHHLGSPRFFELVKQTIKDYKQRDYVLFYEYVNFDAASDILQKKIRHLTGFLTSESGYTRIANHIPGITVQHNHDFLGIVNDLDFNIDYSPQRIIQEYEDLFGEIQLDNVDISTPIELEVDNPERDKLITQLVKVLLENRTNYLAQKVNSSEFHKILVLFGARHSDFLLRGLIGLDPTWQEIGVKLNNAL